MSSKVQKKNRKKNGRRTQKAGETRSCYIVPLPNNNLKIIRGRRKYVTKNFDISPESRNLVYSVANNHADTRNCILVARAEDKMLWAMKQMQKKKWREHIQLSRKVRKGGRKTQGSTKKPHFKSTIPLSSAVSIIDNIILIRQKQKMSPLTIAVLDAGGNTVAVRREDGSAIMRAKIAYGKAYAALSMGLNTRALQKLLEDRPTFMTSLSVIGNETGKGWVAVPGGVLILNKSGTIIGSVGVTGDTSDNDEKAAVLALKKVGLNSSPAKVHN